MTSEVTNPRYKAFMIVHGEGAPNWEFMAFISDCLKFANARGKGVDLSSDGFSLQVTDHDVFTSECFEYAASMMAATA